MCMSVIVPLVSMIIVRGVIVTARRFSNRRLLLGTHFEAEVFQSLNRFFRRLLVP